MMDGGSDDGPSMEAGGDPGILCGAKYCNVQSQQCCITGTGQAEQHMCSGQGDNCSGTPMTCDDTTDCPMGMVCCGQLDQTQTFYMDVSCQSDCSNFDQRQFCNIMAPDCPMGTMCNPSTILPGYHACK